MGGFDSRAWFSCMRGGGGGGGGGGGSCKGGRLICSACV